MTASVCCSVREGSVIHQCKEMLPSVTAFLLGIALPSSTFLIHLSLVLVLLCVLLRWNGNAVKVLMQNPLVWLPMVIFSLLSLSLLWQQNVHGLEMVAKYRKLLYVLPLALFFLLSRRLIDYFIKGFLLANAVILVMSLLIAVFHLPFGSHNPLNPTVFKLHITQNFFMALAALFWLQNLFFYQGIKRWAYAFLVAITLYNVLFMLLGRTGYVALIAAIAVWTKLSLPFRQQLMVAACAAFLACIFIMVPNRSHDRLQLGIQEMEECSIAVAEEWQLSCSSSMGLRKAFVLKSWQLIKQAPLFGHGAGGFFYAIPEAGYKVSNPHNEYLLQTVQLGLIGLVLFLAWMLSIFRAAWQQSPVIKNLFIALLSSYMVCNLFNSFLLDSSEGNFFIVVTAILASYSICSKTAAFEKISNDGMQEKQAGYTQ
ncbi:O-antigen ligase family protein [Candidatus Regiella endosymbiont of Tuberolachnus salignus]|uniref:O-antigen ligase family protein n=1 Tax=Candidatus Regiella endosymbiont of Tuberolachnus salignus TaxID=3077956 RepID=UPI0030CA71F4